MSTVSAVFAVFADVYFRERENSHENRSDKSAISAKTANNAFNQTGKIALSAVEGSACRPKTDDEACGFVAATRRGWTGGGACARFRLRLLVL